MNLVVIAAFREKPDAIGAQRALEAAGIAGEVRERSDELPRLCVDAFADGFDVVVGEADADSAIAFLQRLWPDEPESARPLVRCPECGSTDVYRLRRLRLFLVAAIVLLAAGAIARERELFLLMIGVIGVLLAIMPPWRCRSCRSTWR
ncbi:MAG TPA: hypothetical protein VNA69_22000 [Thermoanaerobaculia bacterium]|nr:hypothetical protein [Thermoanaerobaculia bacterium]